MKCSNRQPMVSSAKALLLAVLMPSAVAAQQRADTLGLSPALQERVGHAVSTRWNATADRLRLEWGVVRQGRSISKGAVFRLVSNGTDGWFVVLFERDGRSPLAVRLRVALVDSVPVASRPLIAGATLLDADVAYAERARWGPPVQSRATFPSAGWRVRRAIRAGEALTAPKVAPPLLVRVGEPVQLVWSRGGVRIIVEGLAVNAAMLGEEVRVRLADRRGKARGIVTGPGMADLTGSITR